MTKKKTTWKYLSFLPTAAMLLMLANCTVAPKQQEATEEAEETEVIVVETPAQEIATAAPEEVTSEPAETVDDSHIWDTAEKMPEFPGGEEALMKYLKNHLKYPESAKENDKEGRVIVQFVVDKNGKVNNVEVVRGVDAALDSEAVRMVSEMPEWTPGEQNGKPVNVKYTLPVLFKLG